MIDPFKFHPWLTRAATLALMALAAACGSSHDPAPAPAAAGTVAAGGPPAPAPSVTPIGFAEVQAQVIGPRCATCHAGARPAGQLALESYAEVTGALDRIRNEVFVEGSMPADGPLTDAQKSLLQAWIDQGAKP